MDKNDIQLEENWQWEDEWSIDVNRAVDQEGWEYCMEPSLGGWSSTEKIFHLVRRRRWTRTRTIIDLDVFHKNQKDKKIESVKEGWEYSKLFSTKFHVKEDSLDTVRRRRWHRPMQPINDKANLSVVFCFEHDQVLFCAVFRSTNCLKYERTSGFSVFFFNFIIDQI